MKDYFLSLKELVDREIRKNEKYLLNFSAEDMDYARFNHAKFRQAGNVVQKYLSIDLIDGQKHAKEMVSLRGNVAEDRELIRDAVNNLRDAIKSSKDDPYLMMNEKIQNSEKIKECNPFCKDEILDSIVKDSNGLDLVGSYIGGPIYRGFANSFGQINWFSKKGLIIDFSAYYKDDKAVKLEYADEVFNKEAFSKKLDEASLGLSLLKKENHDIKPGSYRAYLSPSCVFELLSMLNWDGFSKKALMVKNSPLMPLAADQQKLSPFFSLYENINSCFGPNFQEQGFLKPDLLPVIKEGRLHSPLVSPKTGKEYSIDHNGAHENEDMGAMEMAEGGLDEHSILKTLDDGLVINNLWYLNFSDRVNGRLTGMTRFLCYVVKNGKAIAPFSVMRFDDSIYRIFGDNLANITKQREYIMENSSYEQRSTNTALLPGIIVNDLKLTL